MRQANIERSTKETEVTVTVNLDGQGKYDIKTGNTFKTTIKNHQFLIEKTSAGIKVVNHFDIQSIAMAPNHNANM